MRTVLGYEGEGRRRRPVWSKNQPAEAPKSARPHGSLVVGAPSSVERHRIVARQHKAAKAAVA